VTIVLVFSWAEHLLVQALLLDHKMELLFQGQVISVQVTGAPELIASQALLLVV
jgi:hypothetical protein